MGTNKRHAFTLIEMLVVMAIMGIVAAMVVGMSKAVGTKRTAALVDSDKFKLVHMINNYQSKMNFYPPDNAFLVTVAPGNPNFENFSATNPLIYELTGCTNLTTNSPPLIQVFDGTSNVTATLFTSTYARGTVANSNPDEPHNFYRPGPKPNEYAYYPGQSALAGLLVPADGLGANNKITATNFWHYDASTPYRHNQDSFDLWAEYVIDVKNGVPVVVTNGNW